jgi:hypothetical protein
MRERLIVTRHCDPKAVVLGLRDAMEILAAPAFSELADAARRDMEGGETLEPWPGVGPVGIAMARAAAEIQHRLGARDRGALRRALCRGDADRQRPLWLPTGHWLVPFSYEGETTALVHALIDARALEREVIGEEVWQRRLRRDLDRHTHSRAPWQRGG